MDGHRQPRARHRYLYFKTREQRPVAAVVGGLHWVGAGTIASKRSDLGPGTKLLLASVSTPVNGEDPSNYSIGMLQGLNTNFLAEHPVFWKHQRTQSRQPQHSSLRWDEAAN